MRKLVVGTFATLDGVMQAPGAPEDDRDGAFEHGGWSVGYWDELMGRLADETHMPAGGILFGRRTYEILASPLAARRRRRSDGGEAQRLPEVRRLADAEPGGPRRGRTRRCSRATWPRPSRRSRPRMAGTSS